MFLRLYRDPGERTRIGEPREEDAVWGELQLVGVLVHSGGGSLESGGHWVAYCKRNGQWWCLDSAHSFIINESPFSDNTYNSGYNIEVLMFKE